VHVDHLWLTDFRNHRASELVPAPIGLTVISGGNGQGKTNLLEAVGYLATLTSFRGAHPDALVRVGAGRAAVRAEARRGDRAVLIEAVLDRDGGSRAQVNKQALRRTRDLVGVFHVTVFGPDDLMMVKGGPQDRRRYLDELLVGLRPQYDALRRDFERIVRQRNALLRQAGGQSTGAVTATLDVWDAKLAETGTAVADARAQLASTLQPAVSAAYDRVAESSVQVAFGYERSWSGPLDAALMAARPDDLRRGTSTVGPHHDDLVATIGGLSSRTHASQGEQRSLALALRLGGHQELADTLGSRPVLLLDDVFSELDPDRSEALLAALPPGQVLLTTTGAVPASARPEVVAHVVDGKVLT
jgi:DNA replication and repair protein RecF